MTNKEYVHHLRMSGLHGHLQCSTCGKCCPGCDRCACFTRNDTELLVSHSPWPAEVRQVEPTTYINVARMAETPMVCHPQDHPSEIYVPTEQIFLEAVVYPLDGLNGGDSLPSSGGDGTRLTGFFTKRSLR